jgi:hypothetical protein
MFALAFLAVSLPKVYGTTNTETRYMSSTVVASEWYNFTTTQTSSEVDESLTSSGGSSYLGIRVYLGHADGTRTEITSGTAVAIVHVSGTSSFSATWSCPQTACNSSDGIQIWVYDAATCHNTLC